MVAGAAWGEAPLRSLRPRPRPVPGLDTTPIPPPRPEQKPEDLIARAGLGGDVGFAVADAETGLVLESHAAGDALPPASVTKIATSEYALETLGADFRFETTLVATGPLREGTLEGDLVLVGSGDPLIDTDTLAALVAEAHGAGLRRVSGRFLVWGGALPYVRSIDPAQPAHVGYSPSVGGLNLNFNRVYFEWKRAGDGWDVRMDARSETLAPPVKMAAMQVVDRDLPTYTYRDDAGVDRWTVAAAALNNAGSRWLPVRQPDIYAGEVVRWLAKARGIALSAPARAAAAPTGAVLARHRSMPLEDIIRDMLKWSTNLVAETIGMAASLKRGVAVASLDDSARAMTAWLRERYGVTAAAFHDHSGLGGDNRISAADLVRMLVKLGPGSRLHGLLKPIVPMDDDGERNAKAGHSIVAKTGTLNFVSALAGYVTVPDGTVLAFAVLAADTPRREAIAPGDMERPEGGRAWTRRARLLQQQLINRWVGLYGG